MSGYVGSRSLEVETLILIAVASQAARELAAAADRLLTCVESRRAA